MVARILAQRRKEEFGQSALVIGSDKPDDTWSLRRFRELDMKASKSLWLWAENWNGSFRKGGTGAFKTPPQSSFNTTLHTNAARSSNTSEWTSASVPSNHFFCWALLMKMLPANG
jgi:hypothetical protein